MPGARIFNLMAHAIAGAPAGATATACAVRNRAAIATAVAHATGTAGDAVAVDGPTVIVVRRLAANRRPACPSRSRSCPIASS